MLNWNGIGTLIVSEVEKWHWTRNHDNMLCVCAYKCRRGENENDVFFAERTNDDFFQLKLKNEDIFAAWLETLTSKRPER